MKTINLTTEETAVVSPGRLVPVKADGDELYFGDDLVEVRQGGEFAGYALYLPSCWEYELGVDSEGSKVLLPLLPSHLDPGPHDDAKGLRARLLDALQGESKAEARLAQLEETCTRLGDDLSDQQHALEAYKERCHLLEKERHVREAGLLAEEINGPRRFKILGRYEWHRKIAAILAIKRCYDLSLSDAKHAHDYSKLPECYLPAEKAKDFFCEMAECGFRMGATI